MKYAYNFLLIFFLIIGSYTRAQELALARLLSDSSITNASVSFIITDAKTGEKVTGYNSEKSLVQASLMKLVTTAAALELLGPDYKFITETGYTGRFSRRNGTLTGDIIIKGGGDPCLGSERFGNREEFVDRWIAAFKEYGIRKVKGRVITDDTHYDYEPVPTGWAWEDIGNYYGAGVHGLSVFDNTIKIQFRTMQEGTVPEMISTDLPHAGVSYRNYLISSGTTDKGYVFCPPYGDSGWISGSIPADRKDFVLKASIPDPPLLMAKILTEKLKHAGIRVFGKPSTYRLLQAEKDDRMVKITESASPPLSRIIEVLNHESVNLYAEHLMKEAGKVINGEGSFRAGKMAISGFIRNTGIYNSGMFISDGSGLSPGNALNAVGIATLLCYMKTRSSFSDVFFNSLPEAGREGTLKSVFRDPVFEGRLRAKSGSMNRVRSYAGYLTAMSGRELVFCIIINNFTCSSAYVTSLIEELMKEAVLNL